MATIFRPPDVSGEDYVLLRTFLVLSFLSIHLAQQPRNQMYFGGSVLDKASTIGIDISPTPPLIFTGESKSAKFGVIFNIT